MIYPSGESFSRAITVGTRHAQGVNMRCLRGTKVRKARPGDWRCKDCGVVSAKKKKLCNPKKVK
jgi:hypothetical protein